MFWQWRRIDQGREFIPWGTFWGGRGDMGGDMDQLSQLFSWSDNTIIITYRTLGDICLWIIIGVYLSFTWQQKANVWLTIKNLFNNRSSNY